MTFLIHFKPNIRFIHSNKQFTFFIETGGVRLAGCIWCKTISEFLKKKRETTKPIFSIEIDRRHDFTNFGSEYFR